MISDASCNVDICMCGRIEKIIICSNSEMLLCLFDNLITLLNTLVVLFVYYCIEVQALLENQ